MSLHIQMIGTGSAFAKNYYNTSALVRSDNATILIDCGFNTPRSLHELGITPDQIDGIAISHIHADHIGGLEEIAFRLLYQHNKKKTKLFLTDTLAGVLWENTLKGGMYNPEEGFYCLDDYFDVILLEERQPSTIASDLTIEFIPTLHILRKASYSLFINNQTFYSADIRFSEELLLHEVVKHRNCHTILHDCQLSGRGAIHATLEELLTLPEDVQKRIYLMHYDDKMPDYIGKTGHMSFIKQHQLLKLSE
ncbi:ribonuclease Z [Paenibacillus sp. SYP-B3998]|uniref:Ribonuclease Z n=1 Tax=Paenibacillus sp. SYP-B3998 TaxID=2678564 RepID=A0A6G3ZUJ3_9BACL|nr:MBL fold metallo-hydrolase [Paenibacillus sp. SYP-B3998]NEW05374.1 ribonuclease Z [Paenibacillus sp. SYP-B3998]